MAGVVRREMLSERVRSIKPSGIRKFFDIAATMSDVISLGVGEPDFVTPDHIRQAGIDSINAGDTHYTSNWGTLALRQAISENIERRYGVHYDPATEVMVTVGVSEGIDVTLRAVLDEGDGVALPDPGYVAYEADVMLAGGEVVPVHTHVEEEFEVRAAALEAALTPRTKVVLLGNPNNPTGSVIAKPNWKRSPRSPSATTCWSSATRSTVGWSTAKSTPASPRCRVCASARCWPMASRRRMR